MTSERIESSRDALLHAYKALTDISAALATAAEIRWDAPPGFCAIPNADGVVNPTLDLVVDPRRVELGRAAWDAQMELTRVARLLEERAAALRVAVEKWGGGA